MTYWPLSRFKIHTPREMKFTISVYGFLVNKIMSLVFLTDFLQTLTL